MVPSNHLSLDVVPCLASWTSRNRSCGSRTLQEGTLNTYTYTLLEVRQNVLKCLMCILRTQVSFTFAPQVERHRKHNWWSVTGLLKTSCIFNYRYWILRRSILSLTLSIHSSVDFKTFWRAFGNWSARRKRKKKAQCCSFLSTFVSEENKIDAITSLFDTWRRGLKIINGMSEP